MDIVLRHLEGSLSQWVAVNFGRGEYLSILSSIKGFRNGMVYGIRIRAPHAFVMVMLFGQGTLKVKLKTILRMTWTHAINLARFVFSYKALLGFLRKLSRQFRLWHPFVAAFIPGYFVFGQGNGVNTQINLYLLSRVIYGLVKLGVEKHILIQPSFSLFPWFAAFLGA
uniref:Uncharacterized protein n=1 Tax=Ditylenchus dipsaci TaxID=166011 RepID=A0A915E4B3_9BILA